MGLEEEVFCFLLFLPKQSVWFAAARSGQGRAGFWARRSAPLRARTAATESSREEKTWLDHLRNGGQP